jgi:hypothetical protein
MGSLVKNVENVDQRRQSTQNLEMMSDLPKEVISSEDSSPSLHKVNSSERAGPLA